MRLIPSLRTLAIAGVLAGTLATGCAGNLVTNQRPPLAPTSPSAPAIDCERVIAPGRVACIDRTTGRRIDDQWFTYTNHGGVRGWWYLTGDPELLQGDTCPEEDSCAIVWSGVRPETRRTR